MAIWHSIILALIGALLLIMSLILMRRGRLAVRYGFGWAAVGIVAILVAPLLPVLDPLARFLGLTVPGLIIAGGAVFLTVVALQLSMMLSSMDEEIRLLAERSAVLEAELARSSSGVAATSTLPD